jgi:hypothetical protein
MSEIENMNQAQMDTWAKDLLNRAASGDVQAIKEVANILDGEPEDADYE